MDEERPGDEPVPDEATAFGPDVPTVAPPPPPPPPPPPGAGTQVVYQVAAPGNGLATASLVVGIIGVVLFWTIWLGLILGVLAIVFGAIGRSRAAQGAPNKGRAQAGLVLGIVAVAGSILVLVFFIVAAMEGNNEIFDQIGYCIDHPNDPMC